MKRLRPFLLCAVFMLMAAGVSGCFPGGDNRQDEERDPHFQRGRDLVNSQEFKAAVEEFEKALETNPRSAAAHFELGWLYEAKITLPDTKLNDYAAAIYHYQRYLLLAPDSPRAPNVRERIRGCKLELAGTEFPLPNSQNLQQQLFAATEENRLLKKQLDEARNHAAANINLAPAPAPAPAQPVRVATAAPSPNLNPGPVPAPAADAQHPRTYVIQAGDSIYGIAKRFGLKANAVLAANASVSPTRLRPGQSLNLP